MKKAQLSIMLVVVTVLVLLAALFFAMTNANLKSDIGLGTSSADAFINLCFKRAFRCDVLRIASNTGDFQFVEGIPPLETINQNMVSYLNSTITRCLDEFHSAETALVVKSVAPSILLNDKNMLVKAKNDIKLFEEKLEKAAKDYRETFDIDFVTLYSNAVRLRSGRRPDGVPESYINLKGEHDVYVFDKDGKKVVSVIQKTRALGNGEVRFNFVK